MLIEGLESRRLLSASLSGGLLTITGTANSDRISLYVGQDGKLHVAEATFVPGTAGAHGTVTRTNTKTGEVRVLPTLFSDMRLMQGVYRGVDGKPHRGAFALV